jgi:hypothetical protein
MSSIGTISSAPSSAPRPLPLFSLNHRDNFASRPPLHRAQPLNFRLTAPYPVVSAALTTPTLTTSSNPSPVTTSTPFDRSPTSMPSPTSLDSPPTLMECNLNDMDDVEMSDDNLVESSELGSVKDKEEEEPVQPRIRIRHSSSPPSLNFQNRPPRLNSQKLYNYHALSPTSGTALSTGRIPTPIHPFFPGNPSPRTHPSMISPAPLSSNSSIFSNHRAMPSPIREDAVAVDLAGSHLSKLTVSGPGFGPFGGEIMTIDDPLSSPTSAGLLSPPLEFDEFGLPIRKGRARSGAITSPVTPNKRIFTGYLPTCEKCRNKVPGHYMHFL